MYACGPTVYQSAHIGNMRTYLFEDILRRTLEYNGYKVRHIMNVTDVGHLTSDEDAGEDKVEIAAKKAGQKVSAITKKYFDEFKGDLKSLNIEMPLKFAWASKYIPEQKAIIERLHRRGYAYVTSDGIYFDSSKFLKYGVLGDVKKRKQEEAKSRAGEEFEKKNPWDFALWKFSDGNRLQEWPSPLKMKKKGFPGWHIECSAISAKELGQPFDIHLGGIDHTTVHHNNEIAQSEAAYGKPLAKYWMHGEFLLMGKDKMSKSLGNVATLTDLISQGIDPMQYRYLVLTSHYRNQLGFYESALESSGAALNKLKSLFDEKKSGGKIVAKYKKKFLAAINDDLATAQALAVVWELVKSKEKLEDKQATILDFDRVLGLNLASYKPSKTPPIVTKLVRERDESRAGKDWKKSDKLRSDLERLGYTVMDTPEGTKLTKKI